MRKAFGKRARSLVNRFKAYPTIHWSLLWTTIKSDGKKAFGISPKIPEDMEPQAFEAWACENGKFRTLWFTPNIPSLAHTLSGRSIHKILEIGSYEGLSTVWFSKLCDNTPEITCVDTFAGSIEHMADEKDMLEEAYDNNIKALVKEQGRIRKLKGTSHEILPKLINDNEEYDLIYVDGSHTALDVLVDGCLGWKLLKRGGVMIFDDYLWGWGESAKDRPLLGVNKFLGVIRGEYVPLWSGPQVHIEKI